MSSTKKKYRPLKLEIPSSELSEKNDNGDPKSPLPTKKIPNSL